MSAWLSVTASEGPVGVTPPLCRGRGSDVGRALFWVLGRGQEERPCAVYWFATISHVLGYDKHRTESF